MNLLLDTMVILWLAREQNRIPAKVFDIIKSPENAIFVSAISSWEYRQKRLKHPRALPVAFDDLTRVMPATMLDFAYDASHHAETLPLVHRDPFDRMLIAQALHHDLTLVTADAAMRRYPVPTLWD